MTLPGTIPPPQQSDPTATIEALAPTAQAIREAWQSLNALRATAHDLGGQAHAIASNIGAQIELALKVAGPRHFQTWAAAHLPFDLATAKRFRQVRQLPPDSRQTWLALDLVPARCSTAEAQGQEATTDAKDERKLGLKPSPHMRAIDEVLRWVRATKVPTAQDRGDTRQLFAELERWHRADYVAKDQLRMGI